MARRIKPQTFGKFYDAIDRMRKGESLTKAARESGTTPRTIQRVNEELDVVRRKSGSKSEYEFTNKNEIILTDNDAWIRGTEPVHLDKRSASTYGKYLNDLKRSSSFGGDDSILQKYVDKPLYDTNGKQYYLMTDVDEILEFMDAMDITWEDLIKSK